MNIKPLGNNIVIKPFESEKETESGIVIERAVEEAVTKGEVVGVGDDVKDVEVGDKVIFRQWSPDEFEIDGEEVLIVSSNDLVGKFE